ncbi:carbonic anhydrase [bacterium]|nr:carbonic anhydrase [bacterium]
MITAQEALARLKEGNRRFVAGERNTDTDADHIRRQELLEGQTPFATILGCSDSRVPAEIVFDQGLGDLFVIRIAGNVVAPSQIGSVEFAAEKFGTPLVVVLGHTQCGAVQATIEEMTRASETQSPHLRSIVERVRPAVESLLHTELRNDHDALMAEAVRANVRLAADHLRHGSRILEQRLLDNELMIVGAEYSLESGMVDFFDSTPQP